MSDRISALNWVYENHKQQLKDLVRINTGHDLEMENWVKKEIGIHQDAMLRVRSDIFDIAFPAQTGQVEEPSCPSDTAKPLSNLDPKQYW